MPSLLALSAAAVTHRKMGKMGLLSDPAGGSSHERCVPLAAGGTRRRWWERGGGKQGAPADAADTVSSDEGSANQGLTTTHRCCRQRPAVIADLPTDTAGGVGSGGVATVGSTFSYALHMHPCARPTRRHWQFLCPYVINVWEALLISLLKILIWHCKTPQLSEGLG